MMSSSSLILVGLHSYWPMLFLIMATLLNNLICYADEASCQHIGCGSLHNRSRPCQCNSPCRQHEDCCKDYNDICASCQHIGCGSLYNRSRPCQCNSVCNEHANCCKDYNHTCPSREQSTDDGMFPQSTTVEKGPSPLVVVLPVTSVLLLIVALIVLVCCVTLRRKRIHGATEENVEERDYYEVGNSNERSYEGVLPSDEVNRYERNIGYNFSTSAINGTEGQLVENVAYESYK